MAVIFKFVLLGVTTDGQTDRQTDRDAVADPGFPIGRSRPLMQVLFGENVCKNKRIGSHWGGGRRRDRPMDQPMEWTKNNEAKMP